MGRVDGRLPGRVVPAALGGVERPLPRHRCATSGAQRSSGIRDIASRLAGSSDLYADDGRSPYSSVNFVTAHDGFTLRDLVSYDQKHNEANGERNRDGTDNNRSWNCGVEGETDDEEIIALRHRQAAEPDGDAVPVERRADAHGRRRARPHPARQQQRLRARTTRSPGSTGGPTTRGSTSTSSPRRRCGCAASIRRSGSGTTSTARPPSRAARRTWPGCTPPGGRWPRDWDDDDTARVGMFLSGDPLRSPGPRGEQQRDASFMIWLNGSTSPSTSPCPRTSGCTPARWSSPPTPT